MQDSSVVSSEVDALSGGAQVQEQVHSEPESDPEAAATHVADQTAGDANENPSNAQATPSSISVLDLIGPSIAIALFLFFVGPPLLRGFRRVLGRCGAARKAQNAPGDATRGTDQSIPKDTSATERRARIAERYEKQLEQQRAEAAERRLEAAQHKAEKANVDGSKSTRVDDFKGSSKRAGEKRDASGGASSASESSRRSTATAKDLTKSTDQPATKSSKLASRDPRALKETKEREKEEAKRRKASERGSQSLAQQRMKRTIAIARGEQVSDDDGTGDGEDNRDGSASGSAPRRTISPAVASLVPTTTSGSMDIGSVRPDYYGEDGAEGASNGGSKGTAAAGSGAAGAGRAQRGHAKADSEQVEQEEEEEDEVMEDAGAGKPLAGAGGSETAASSSSASSSGALAGMETAEAREALIRDRDARYQASLAADRSRTEARKLRVQRRRQRLQAARARLAMHPEPEMGATRPMPSVGGERKGEDEDEGGAAAGGAAGKEGGDDGSNAGESEGEGQNKEGQDEVVLLKVRAHGLAGKPRKRRFWRSDRVQLVMDWLEVEVGNKGMPPVRKQLFDDPDPEIAGGLGGMRGAELRKIAGGQVLCSWRDFDVSIDGEQSADELTDGAARSGSGEGPAVARLQEGMSPEGGSDLSRVQRTLAEVGIRKSEALRLMEVEKVV